MRVMLLEDGLSTDSLEIIEQDKISYWGIDGSGIDAGHSVVVSATSADGLNVSVLFSKKDIVNLSRVALKTRGGPEIKRSRNGNPA